MTFKCRLTQISVQGIIRRWISPKRYKVHGYTTEYRPLITRSSAVAKRPRDASCLSVVSFVASIVQYLKRSFFIISYFSFGFTSAHNSILFCCLRSNVKPCCHTYGLSWLCIVREHAWSLSRWRTTETVTLSRVALGGRIPAVYDQRYECHNLQGGGRHTTPVIYITAGYLIR